MFVTDPNKYHIIKIFIGFFVSKDKNCNAEINFSTRAVLILSSVQSTHLIACSETVVISSWPVEYRFWCFVHATPRHYVDFVVSKTFNFSVCSLITRLDGWRMPLLLLSKCFLHCHRLKFNWSSFNNVLLCSRIKVLNWLMLISMISRGRKHAFICVLLCRFI